METISQSSGQLEEMAQELLAQVMKFKVDEIPSAEQSDDQLNDQA